MLASLSDNTKSQYSSSYKLWWQYCGTKGIDPIDVNTYNALGFLSQCFEQGSSYGTLNNHRSALSLISRNKLTEDDNLKRFFRGIFRLKPSFPKYNTTWDPSIVLQYLAQFYPNEPLSFDVISKKLVVLLALATGQRCQTLSLIKTTNIKVNEQQICIQITDLVKTSAIGKPQPVLDLPFYCDRPAVCPAETLVTYLSKSSSVRPSDTESLILTSKKPYRAASSQTIGRWIKQTLADSGIDTNVFSAHSTRHAATSAAHRAGASVDVIRRTAGWSQQSMAFANFYKRPLVDSDSNFVNLLFRS